MLLFLGFEEYYCNSYSFVYESRNVYDYVFKYVYELMRMRLIACLVI